LAGTIWPVITFEKTRFNAPGLQAYNKRWQADQISARSSLQFARCTGRYAV